MKIKVIGKLEPDLIQLQLDFSITSLFGKIG